MILSLVLFYFEFCCCSRFIGRFVPFAAVAAANCINLPFMRSTEITEGIQLLNEKGEKCGQSPQVAKSAIAQVNQNITYKQ